MTERNGYASHDSDRPGRSEFDSLQDSLGDLRGEFREHRSESSSRFERLERETRERFDALEAAADTRHGSLVAQITATAIERANEAGEKRAWGKVRSAIMGVLMLALGWVINHFGGKGSPP